MTLFKKDISFALRFKLLILVLSILIESNLLFGHLSKGNISFNKSNHISSVTKNIIDSPKKPKKSTKNLKLSLFESEEDDNFSCSKKGFKLYQLTSTISFNRIVKFSTTERNYISICNYNYLSKQPLYITYQVYRI